MPISTNRRIACDRFWWRRWAENVCDVRTAYGAHRVHSCQRTNFALSWPATTPITQSSCVRQSECEIGFHLQVSHFVFRAGAGADENAERTRDHRARLRARDPVPRHHARFHAHGAIHAIALLQLHLPCVEGGRQADCRKSPVVWGKACCKVVGLQREFICPRRNRTVLWRNCVPAVKVGLLKRHLALIVSSSTPPRHCSVWCILLLVHCVARFNRPAWETLTLNQG